MRLVGSWSEKSEARSISSSEGLLGREEDRIGPVSSTSFSSSSCSGCGLSVRVQMGGVPKRPMYNLN